MKIIKYEKIKKENYNIYLDNGEVITVNGKVITDNELLLKKSIDKDLYNKVIMDNHIYELYELGIKYLKVRLRSIKEMKDYLLKKDDNNLVVNKVCTLLKENKYLDDNVFARAYVKDKMRFTTKGDYKIKKELSSLGVESPIIEDIFMEINNADFEEKIKKIIEKDIRTNKKYRGDYLKNKIYNHLLSQGYSASLIIPIINKYDF